MTQIESGGKVTAAPQGGGNSECTEAKTPAEGRRVWLKNRHASNGEGWLALRELVSLVILMKGVDFVSNLVLHPNYQLYEKQDKAFCSSLQVAQEFGKEHKNVIRDIRNLDCSEDFYKLNFEQIRRTVDLGDGRTRKDPMFLMTRDGFIFLTMGYRGKKAAAIKEAYIKRFNEMEQFIRDYVLARDDFAPFTQAILDAHDEPKSYHYSNEYDMINRIVLGCSAKKYKELHNLGNVPSIRPFLTEMEAKAVRKMQTLDIRLLYRGVDYLERKTELTGLFQEKFPELSAGFERVALLERGKR